MGEVEGEVVAVGHAEALPQKDTEGVGVVERERVRVGVEVTLPLRPVVGVAPRPHAEEVREKVVVGEREGEVERVVVVQEVAEGERLRVGDRVVEREGRRLEDALRLPPGNPSLKPVGDMVTVVERVADFVEEAEMAEAEAVQVPESVPRAQEPLGEWEGEREAERVTVWVGEVDTV